MGRVPLIGVTAGCDRVRFGVWDVETHIVGWSLVEALVAAGTRPVLLPPLDRPDPSVLDRLDGLVLAGGGDVDPVVPRPPAAEVLAARARSAERPARRPAERPVIGITTYREDVDRRGWNVAAALLPAAYGRAVERAGGIPLLLPPLSMAVEETLDAIDGVVLAGGSDIDPRRYAAGRDRATCDVRPNRDAAELALVEHALARDLPVLGICRGHQLLNVALGGTLHQHVPDVVGHEAHRPLPGVYGDHAVELAPGRLAEILGPRPYVRSHHHQSIDRIAEGLAVRGVAHDGVIEAVEGIGWDFVVGVQWHPEEGDDDALIEALVERARGRAPSSGASRWRRST